MATERKKLLSRRALATLAAVLGLCVMAYASPKYTVLHSFTGGTDGDGNAGVIPDHNGNVYGTSLGGGTGNCGNGRPCGLIFELTPGPDGNWAFTVLYDFTGGSDAGSPNSPLTLDASGNLYGTTVSGGVRGGGTVFELTPGAGGWTMTVLYSFCNQKWCAGLPRAGVVMDPAGRLYGTFPGLPSGGAVYRLAKVSGKWNETLLHQFCPNGPPCDDGDTPYAGVIVDASSNLYGTTSYGGTGCGGDGCGTVYELSPVSGGKWKETVLHRFDNNGKDGYTPGNDALFMDAQGNLYGTTEIGGSGTGMDGTVFRLTPGAHGRWNETILYNFNGGADGGFPAAGVVMDKTGNLYGTGEDSSSGCGLIYKLTPKPKGEWKYTIVHTFLGPDGCVPVGNLAIDSKGNLYGGAIFGGQYGYGVVFQLTP